MQASRVLVMGAEDLAFSGTVEPAGETVIAFGIAESFGDQMIVRRYVYINVGDGESYQLILEAPAEQWAEQVSLLECILASILIEPS